MKWWPIIGASIAGGVAAAVLLRKGDDEPERVIEGARAEPIIIMPSPTSTGYKLVNAILDKLRSAAQSSGIPLGVMVGWVAKESGGKLTSTTSLDERGYFQLMPDESKSLGLDHQRLSMDPDYSIAAGVKLIQKYADKASGIAIAPKGSSYFWRLVKLIHTMGASAVAKIIAGAKDAGAASSWDALERHALANEARYLHETKHSPSKWFPLVDQVYQIGFPFGFGNDPTMVAGDPTVEAYDLARMLASEWPNGTTEEQQAAAWATRNRAAFLGVTIGHLLTPTGEYGPQDEVRQFASTSQPPTDATLAVAHAVLSLPPMSDPTGGAVDFWNPAAHARGNAASVAGLLEGYEATPDELRADFHRNGLRVLGCVGNVELLG